VHCAVLNVPLKSPGPGLSLTLRQIGPGLPTILMGLNLIQWGNSNTAYTQNLFTFTIKWWQNEVYTILLRF